MFLKFAGAADLESWARGYRLAVTATADEAVVAGIGGYICQHSDELLAVTITRRWVSCRNKLVTAGGEVVQDGDDEGTVAFDPNDTEASLAVLRSVHLTPSTSPQRIIK
jgi:hypothetical protein